MQAGRPYTKFVTRLESIIKLSAEDRALLEKMPTTVRSYGSDEDIVRQGEAPAQCCLLLDGFLYRHKIGAEARQIMSFHVPGDVPDLHSLHLSPMDHSLSTLGPTAVAFIPHSYFHEVLPKSQTLTHILWRETLVDAAVYREWEVNLGTRDAISRIAHVFCELKTRLEAVGLTDGSSFKMPLRQTHLADACGITTVHVNRMVQELRRKGLIEWDGTIITILRWNELVEIGDFRADYLHLRK
jgi:CRP-like cAMP-binding protein